MSKGPPRRPVPSGNPETVAGFSFGTRSVFIARWVSAACFGGWIAFVTAGCSGGTFAGGEAVPQPPFEDCAADAYAFVGEASLTQLGLDADVLPVAPPDPDRVGTIWVMATRDYPYDAGPPGGGVVMTRAFCVQYPDGEGLSGWPIADTWSLPPRFAPASTTFGAWPDALPAVLIGVLLVIAVSVWAFRGRRAPR